MVERKPNEVKIVGWLLVAKKLIKFANDETSYKISDNVMAKSNFDKFPLKKGDTVEVSIAEGVVTYIRKQKSDAPKSEGYGSEEAYEPTPEEEAGTVALAPEVKKEEPKVETVSDSPAVPTKVLTVFACAANKKVVKFLELKDDGWFQISEDIQKQDYATIGLVARNKVLVTFNDKTVISLVKVASEPAEQPKTTTSSPANAKVEPTAAPAAQAPVVAPTAKKEWVPYKSQESDARQNSIECQACINASCQVVGMMAANIEPKPTANVLNSMIKAIATENYNLLQELKKK